jgi:2-(1,2-epoxy-1,2-dihydrophenyl)acetyl-CoA isomerase
MTDLVRIEHAAGVARLTLNRPDSGNAIDIHLSRALMQAAIACDVDSSVRCVLITGAGRMFCVGGDIAAFSGSGAQFAPLLKEMSGYLHMAVSRFARMQKPLVTAVNGPAAGAGLALAMLGDVALASRAAKFNTAYAGIGLSPDGGTTWLMPRLIGLRRAQELVLTGRKLTADEAAEIGLVTRAVEPDALEAEANAVAVQLAAGPTRALGRARSLLLCGLHTGLEEQLELESRAIAASGADFEAQEGVRAYTAKRSPIFNEI